MDDVSAEDPLDEGEGRPLTEEPHGEVVWVKARDTLLGAAPRGREMDDGGEVESEAALVLTAPFTDDDTDALIVIEGSYRRLLKTLDYARAALLGAAPPLEFVWNVGDGAPGLRCPHCGFTTWAGVHGITVVEAGERYRECTIREAAGVLELTGEDPAVIAGAIDHYECGKCERPVELPARVRVP